MSVRGKGSPHQKIVPAVEREGEKLLIVTLSHKRHTEKRWEFFPLLSVLGHFRNRRYTLHIYVCAHPVHVYLKHVLCCGRTGGAWLLAPFFVPTLAMERLGKTESCLYCISLTRRVLFPLLQESTVPKMKGMLAAGTKQNSGAGSGYSANPQLPCYLHARSITPFHHLTALSWGPFSLPLSAFNLSQVERKRRRERAKDFCHQNFYYRSPYSSVGVLIFFGMHGQIHLRRDGNFSLANLDSSKKSERREQALVLGGWGGLHCSPISFALISFVLKVLPSFRYTHVQREQ